MKGNKKEMRLSHRNHMLSFDMRKYPNIRMRNFSSFTAISKQVAEINLCLQAFS